MTMTKVQDGCERRLPPLVLHLDEVQEVWCAMSSVCKGPVTITTCGYELSSFDDVKQLREEETRELAIRGQSPSVSVYLTNCTAWVRSSEGTLEAEGLVSRLETILTQGKVWTPRLLRFAWFLPSGLFVLSLLAVRLEPRCLWPASLLMVLLAALYIHEIRLSLIRYSVVRFRSRKDSVSFFRRNRDQIWLLAIGAVLGGFLTDLVPAGLAFIQGLLRKCP